MYEWTIACSFLLLIISIYYWLNRYSYFDKLDVIHKKPLPFVGNSLPFLIRSKTFAEFIEDAYNLDRDAKYVGLYDFSDPVVVIRDPELIKNITIKSFDHFVDHRTIIDSEQEPLFTKNLFGLRGNQWREVRNLLSPAFTSSKMKAMFKLMSDCAENFADYLKANADNESTINSKDAFTKYTTDVIATCAFGVAVDTMRNPNNEFYVLGKKATSFDGIVMLFKFFMMRASPTLSKLFGIRFTDRRVEIFFTELVKNTIETRDREGITRPDMIQLMMESRNNKPGDGPILTIQDMVCQAFVFFFGGFDSTSSVMCFVAHSISTNPNIQKKLQDEVDDVYEKCGESLTYEAINNMEYLDATINEALRLFPIQPAVDRVCTKTFELPPALPGRKSVIIKPGDGVFLPIYALHRDPEFFPNPNEFYPERFLEDPKGTLHSPAYMPFGAGPRMCIGNRFALLEIKVLLFHLLAKCTLRPGKNMILPLELSKTSFAMTAKGGFWLSLEPRNKWNKKL
ncbi:cytochrome P450 9e2-like [Fopius arisanus]|uniref:Cytochrome P450 9e2-like n=1 Tax=Fopius arisanus TaxID=64838 RepID=A0A9R1TGD3_9HYME|nr:PREDICTED: cytochrome P450 9e2-like [Fopius arisanus]